jgi:hypothetical protein
MTALRSAIQPVIMAYAAADFGAGDIVSGQWRCRHGAQNNVFMLKGLDEGGWSTGNVAASPLRLLTDLAGSKARSGDTARISIVIPRDAILSVHPDAHRLVWQPKILPGPLR